jgi:hypothetical protein
MQMATSDSLVSAESALAGIVEIERDGMIHRGAYRTAAAIVTVTYGSEVRQMQMRRRTDTPHGVAQVLLRQIVAKMSQNV